MTVMPSRSAMPITRRHIGDVAAHVREQQVLGATRARLRLEIGEIHGQIRRDLDQHMLSARVRDRAWHRRQREGIHQHFVAGLHARADERQKHRAAARIGGDAVFGADRRGELFFQQRHLGLVAERLAVAMQPARAQQRRRARAMPSSGIVRRLRKIDVRATVPAMSRCPSLTPSTGLPLSRLVPGKYLSRRTSAERACASMPSVREMRAVASATSFEPSRVMRCHDSGFRNLCTERPAE